MHTRPDVTAGANPHDVRTITEEYWSGSTVDDGLIAELEEIVRERLGNWPSCWEGYHWPGYTWEHTLRVRDLAVTLAQRVGADAQVVTLAALLHDIEKSVGGDHARVGAQTARSLLEERQFSRGLVEQAVSAIATHAGENSPASPPESLALGDADLIDANFGLVGTWRFITIRAGHGSELEETIEGIWSWLRRKEEMVHYLFLPEARKLAIERVAYSRVFCTHAVRALENGRNTGVLSMARHVNAECARGSLCEQLPALETIARQSGERSAVAACRRLAEEAAGHA